MNEKYVDQNWLIMLKITPKHNNIWSAILSTKNLMKIFHQKEKEILRVFPKIGTFIAYIDSSILIIKTAGR